MLSGYTFLGLRVIAEDLFFVALYREVFYLHADF